MKKIAAKSIGIDQGEEQVFSDFDTGGEMWVASGPRERRKRVLFSEPFLSPPAVQVGLSLWDISNSANIRADIKTDRIDERGFDLVFRTWQDSKVARVRMSWTAIGEVENEEIWEI